LSPADLAPAVQKRSLRDRSPLVFLNACRTADDIPGLTRTMGWATQFMAAGAGAFLGTLWAVRSSTAQRFTEAFYACLVTAGRPLGQAALEARRAIADADDGDPTWLAYSVYGHPGVTVAAEAASPLTTGGTDEPRPTP
jgi:CHAT domain-containing protein